MATKKKTKPKSYKLPRPYTEIGNGLKTAREAAKLTQRQVSDKLGYSSAQFISNFERGIAVPPIKKLKVLIGLYSLDAAGMAEMYAEAEKARVLGALA